MLRKHEGHAGIEQKKLIDIQIALANGAWAMTKARQLIAKIGRAPTQPLEHAGEDDSHALKDRRP